ncbi:hypothetical protein ROK90_14055 [Cronobacter dublinensis]|uniref:hypothetical protein n=1 Tax=Cronobacter dublinensis TaxID=413497 RepID=UPI0023DCEEFC|nr:hypothetical protein [Cronobacter dublinensis]MDT3667124.1 hypothetical protein [Cronobacter dublinensis]WEP47594.1 hypothetical protein NNQ27_21855 [Cronobacter dublinensis]
MSVSLSVFSKKAFSINVSTFTVDTNRVFNSLLGCDGAYLNFDIFDSKGTAVKTIEPDADQVYRFIENNIVCSGGCFLYGPDEYWQYHSEEQFNEFSITEINFNPDSVLFVIILSMVIVMANYSDCNYIVDTSGILSITNDDKAKIDGILALKITSVDDDIKKSCALLYERIIGDAWRIE